jgi:5-methylthioadenosine/S-adenosylhomocysteine deaminase
VGRLLLRADDALVDGQQLGATDVLIQDGVIVGVGSRATLAGQARDAPVVTLTDRVLVPGTVNAHNHSFQSLLRGIGDDLPFLIWRARALYRYSPALGEDGVHVGALFAFAEMLLHGVTTVCDFFYLNDGGNAHAEAVINAARRLGMRIVMARCFYDWDGAPAAYRETVPQAVDNFERLSKAFAGHDLVSIHAAPHSLHGASREMIEAAHGAARQAGVPMHIHLAEEAYQVDDALTRYGQRPLHAAAAMGVIDRHTVAVHGCWFDDSERALMAERGASLAYCPGSNMFLGDGVTDVVDLHARGVRVALGSDGGCSNNRVSVFDEMRAAALLQKVHRHDGQAIDAGTCLDMGTRAGGEVLGLPVGRIAVGQRADLVALDLGDPSLWPRQALAKNVVYALSPRAIVDVWVDGREVVRDRQLVRVPLQEIRERVTQVTRDFRRAE